jgi:tripeptidyl-peptidase I
MLNILHLTLFASTVAAYHETMTTTRHDWSPQGQSDLAAQHTVLFVTHNLNVDNNVLTNKLMAVSDPDSPSYGQHLTFKQVNQLTSNPIATQCVEEYLQQIGAKIYSIKGQGQFIRATHDIKTWSKIFKTTFHDYTHQTELNRPSIVRTSEYTLPMQLSSCVDFVGYTTQLPATTKPRMHATPTPLQTKPGTVDPTLLKSFYNIDSYTSSPNVSQAVFEAVGANYSPADLAEWLSYYSFPAQKVARDIGGHNSTALCKTTRPAACIEPNLDLQYLMGTAQGSPTTYWYETNETWPFIAWIEEVMSDETPVTVHSISYAEAEYHVPPTLLRLFSVAAQKLGLMGTTLVVSSGDDGVAGAEARGNQSACKVRNFNPYFPSSCPFVTAVGATQGPENYGSEIAETSNAHPSGGITTGGGFSNFYLQPSYQTSAVATYTATAKMPVGNYNATGMRGYPDVALLGHMYQVMIGGTQFGVSGTSASTPVMAGMINLWNTKRLRKGKSLLGFLNRKFFLVFVLFFCSFPCLPAASLSSYFFFFFFLFSTAV